MFFQRSKRSSFTPIQNWKAYVGIYLSAEFFYVHELIHIQYSLKIMVVWGVVLCRLLDEDRRFGGTCSLHSWLCLLRLCGISEIYNSVVMKGGNVKWFTLCQEGVYKTTNRGQSKDAHHSARLVLERV
jgi:hypothetical protein